MISRKTNQGSSPSFELRGPRVAIRPLIPEDFEPWHEVRVRANDWLTKWEPSALPGSSEVISDLRTFSARCTARDREWQMGTSYGFGLFVGSKFAGEINLSSVQRGPFQNAYVGYWIDEAQAGKGYMPEALVLLFRFVFEDLGLHRLQVSIVPRNQPSRRVAEKLYLRDEGTALRYLEIAGIWEDHIRYAITYEDWLELRDHYLENWLSF